MQNGMKVPIETASFGLILRSQNFSILNVALLRLRLKNFCGLVSGPKSTPSNDTIYLEVLYDHQSYLPVSGRILY
jgi:hypothetical protein